MDLKTELLIAGLIVGSVLLQFGERRVSPWRIVLPLVIVVFFAAKYLTSFPTAGNDLIFELTGAGIGVVTGAIAAALTGVRRNARGDVLVTAGVLYAAFWIAAFAARIGFAVAATNNHDFVRQLGIFSYQHGITGAAAWTAFFILQAVLMVAVRTVVVGVRAFVLQPARRAQIAA